MRRALALACLALLAAGCGDEERPARLTLALDFEPNAAHSGIYAAPSERVRLRIRTPTASTDSLKLLASGRADLAVVDIHDLGLAREKGADVVGVGALVQRPLAAVIARPEIRRPRQLVGKRVGVTGLPSDEAVLSAVVRHDGGDPREVERKTIGFTAVPSLLAGRVDAVVAFWNVEGVALRRRGRRTREFRVDRYGAPRYPELVLVARRRTVRERREQVREGLEAVRAGTRAALADRTAAVRRIAKASGADAALVRAQLAAVAPALQPPVTLDRHALEGWARFDSRFGILRRPPAVKRAFDLDLGR